MPALPACRLVGVASNLGLRRGGCDAGAAKLLAGGLPEALRHYGDRLDSVGLIAPDEASDAGLDRLCARLAEIVADSVAQAIQPWVLGGDHAIAVGTWRGVAAALATGGGALPGLLWIDAHCDAHTPDTTPSGNRHGMPLATLLGFDGSAPAIAARRLALVGIRSWESPERERLEAAGARLFDIAEVRRRGLAACLAEAITIVGGAPFGVSLDIDSLDPALAPGVGCPAPDGLALRPIERGVNHFTCRSRQVTGHWASKPDLKLTISWKGNSVVDMQPRGKGLPFDFANLPPIPPIPEN